MTADLQTVVALIVVVLAVAGLLWGALRKRRRPGCGSDCGCPTTELKRAGGAKK